MKKTRLIAVEFNFKKVFTYLPSYPLKLQTEQNPFHVTQDAEHRFSTWISLRQWNERCQNFTSEDGVTIINNKSQNKSASRKRRAEKKRRKWAKFEKSHFEKCYQKPNILRAGNQRQVWSQVQYRGQQTNVFQNSPAHCNSEKIAKIVPNIKQTQEQKRRDFCTQLNVPEFFENVFLTDESTFHLHRSTIKVWSFKRMHHPVKKVQKF